MTVKTSFVLFGLCINILNHVRLRIGLRWITRKTALVMSWWTAMFLKPIRESISNPPHTRSVSFCKSTFWIKMPCTVELHVLEKSKYTVPIQIQFLNRAVILSKQKFYLGKSVFQGAVLPVSFFGSDFLISCQINTSVYVNPIYSCSQLIGNEVCITPQFLKIRYIQRNKT